MDRGFDERVVLIQAYCEHMAQNTPQKDQRFDYQHVIGALS